VHVVQEGAVVHGGLDLQRTFGVVVAVGVNFGFGRDGERLGVDAYAVAALDAELERMED
jgi:hypothetical protein